MCMEKKAGFSGRYTILEFYWLIAERAFLYIWSLMSVLIICRCFLQLTTFLTWLNPIIIHVQQTSFVFDKGSISVLGITSSTMFYLIYI